MTPTAGAVGGRLRSIDLLRGVAVLLVMLGHSDLGRLPSPLAGMVEPLWRNGGSGVTLFIVISGFSIHLRWSRRRPDEVEPFPVAAFWRRRFVRLYPTYWAALAVVLVTLALAHGRSTFDRRGPFAWGGEQPLALVVVNHLVVVLANVVPAQYIARVWSVALEEQLYAGYSLLQRARRFDASRLVVPAGIASVVTILVAQACSDWQPMTLPVDALRAPLWQLVLTFQVPVNAFAWLLGALLAEWHAGRVALSRRLVDPRAAIALLVAGGALRYCSWSIGPFVPADAIVIPVFALAFASIVAWLVAREAASRALPRPVTPIVRVGLWSYSVYLLHQPFFDLVDERTALPRLAAVALGWALTLAASGLFFHLVERHFIRRAAQPFDTGVRSTLR